MMKPCCCDDEGKAWAAMILAAWKDAGPMSREEHERMLRELRDDLRGVLAPLDPPQPPAA